MGCPVHGKSPATGARVPSRPQEGRPGHFQVYNRVSWLNALSKLMNVGLEHYDAPVLLKFSNREFRRLLDDFREVTIVRSAFR